MAVEVDRLNLLRIYIGYQSDLALQAQDVVSQIVQSAANSPEMNEVFEAFLSSRASMNDILRHLRTVEIRMVDQQAPEDTLRSITERIAQSREILAREIHGFRPSRLAGWARANNFEPVNLGHGWSITFQAGQLTEGSVPARILPELRDYERVSLLVQGPYREPVDVRALGVSEATASRFFMAPETPTFGMALSWSEVDDLVQAIDAAGNAPWAGIAPGIIGWPQRPLWTALSEAEGRWLTDRLIWEHSEDLLVPGRYGSAFYAAPDLASCLPRMGSEARADHAFAVVLADQAKILDLRNEADRQQFVQICGPHDASSWRDLLLTNNIAGLYDPRGRELVVYDTDELFPHSLQALDDPGGANLIAPKLQAETDPNNVPGAYVL